MDDLTLVLLKSKKIIKSNCKKNVKINNNLKNINIENNNNLNIKIYILCHNENILEKSKNIYAKYNWAYPILLKYQDATFENTFWKQLLEIEEDWINNDMIGTLSSSSYLKIDLDVVNNILLTINNETKYYHFKPDKSDLKILSKKEPHPNFNIIWKNIINELKLNDCKEYYCNYWICKSIYIKDFINWYLNIALPVVKQHELIMTNSKYKYGRLDNKELEVLCGVPYYPILPFILERLIPCYFINL